MLRLYLFGGFRAEFNDQPLPVPNLPEFIWLWAYLLLHARRPAGRDQLAFILWPDCAEAEARAQLRRHLHHLRELLPAASPQRPWLLAEGRTPCWNPDADYWLDVEQFSHLADQLDTVTLEQCAECAELYQGLLLPKLSDAWLAPPRTHLRDQYLRVLNRLIELHTARADYAAALAAAEQRLDADPHSEQTHRLLMRLRYLAGDRAGALRQFDEYQAQLQQAGLPVQLSPETLALHAAIMSGTALDETPPIPHPSSTPIVEKPVARPAIPRWLILLITVMLTFGGLLAGLWFYRPFSPLQTLTLTGPQAVQDTWIISSWPEAVSAGNRDEPWLYVDLYDGRGAFNPRLPFAQYPAARLNLASGSVIDVLLQFNLEQLPDAAYIESARLKIHLEPSPTADQAHLHPATITAYRVLRHWQAATVTFNSPWSAPGLEPGVDYAATPLDRQTVPPLGDLTFNLVDAFPAWQSGQNFGLLLMVTEAPAGEAPYWLDTVEHPDPTLWPQLVIQYR